MEILFNCFQVVTLLRNDNRKKLEKKVNEWIDNRFPIVDDREKSEVFQKLAKYSNAEFKRFAPYDPMVLMRLGLQMMQSQCENWLHVLKHPQIENYPSDQVSLLHQYWMINPHQEYSWAHYCEQLEVDVKKTFICIVNIVSYVTAYCFTFYSYSSLSVTSMQL